MEGRWPFSTKKSPVGLFCQPFWRSPSHLWTVELAWLAFWGRAFLWPSQRTTTFHLDLPWYSNPLGQPEKRGLWKSYVGLGLGFSWTDFDNVIFKWKFNLDESIFDVLLNSHKTSFLSSYPRFVGKCIHVALDSNKNLVLVNKMVFFSLKK